MELESKAAQGESSILLGIKTWNFNLGPMMNDDRAFYSATSTMKWNFEFHLRKFCRSLMLNKILKIFLLQLIIIEFILCLSNSSLLGAFTYRYNARRQESVESGTPRATWLARSLHNKTKTCQSIRGEVNSHIGTGLLALLALTSSKHTKPWHKYQTIIIMNSL